MTTFNLCIVHLSVPVVAFVFAWAFFWITVLILDECEHNDYLRRLVIAYEEEEEIIIKEKLAKMNGRT